MTSATLILPHQLYKDHPALQRSRTVFLLEEQLYFTQFKFHQQKLVLHRASMQYYQNWLQKQGYTVQYVAFHEQEGLKNWLREQIEQGLEELHYADPTDDWLRKRLQSLAKETGLQLHSSSSPNFLTQIEQFDELFGKSYFMNSFYQKQRKRLNILVNSEGNPEGGKWSFDEENRKKLPKKVGLPNIYWPKQNEYVKEALEYVQEHFPDNYGDGEEFRYAVTHAEAEACLDDFLQNRMHLFGDYEDALTQRSAHLFHSVLTPYLNIGLLQPQQIIDRTLELHQEKDFPLNCLEGFIRQIIGWREYMRAIYELEGVKERTTNFWGFDRKIPECFWEGSTGLPPIDLCIERLQKNAYNHHIERLMILGNIMLLCEFDPKEVYSWFMEWYIDAYDWVMVPNVYGMSQFADGGLICTKPYLSGSNYIRKMSDFPKGDWCATWDGLYWRFIDKHRDVIKKNHRMAMMVSMYDRMKEEKKAAHHKQAKAFLKRL